VKTLALFLILVPCLASADYFEMRTVVETGKGAKIVKMPKSGEELTISDDIIVSKKHVEEAKVVETEENRTAVLVTLNEEGAKRLTEATKDGIPGSLRIIVLIDGKPVTAPVVQSVPLGKSFQIDAGTREESEQIAKELLRKK
jgi:preprotein translocase subunit SecD